MHPACAEGGSYNSDPQAGGNNPILNQPNLQSDQMDHPVPGVGNAEADRDGDESDEDDEAEGGDADQGVQVDLLQAGAQSHRH